MYCMCVGMYYITLFFAFYYTLTLTSYYINLVLPLFNLFWITHQWMRYPKKNCTDLLFFCISFILFIHCLIKKIGNILLDICKVVGLPKLLRMGMFLSKIMSYMPIPSSKICTFWAWVHCLLCLLSQFLLTRCLIQSCLTQKNHQWLNVRLPIFFSTACKYPICNY